MALRVGVLTRSGALAAFGVGTLTYAAGELPFTAVLLAFFVPSVAVSRVGRARKRALVDIAKGGPRDALQVMANGGIATGCALAFALTGDGRWARAFGGAYAAATADTWATEIGTLASERPRSIFSLRPIAAGISGGITATGTAAEVAGAAWLGGVAACCLRGTAVASRLPLSLAVTAAGIAGATIDSVLGGSLQELRSCPACERSCETDPHACGASTRLVRGVRGITNDVVNLAATATGAFVAFVF